MTQLIVPALPVERVQYERAYVLGLEAIEGSTDSVDRDPAVRDVTIPITSIRWTTSLGAVRRGTMAPI